MIPKIFCAFLERRRDRKSIQILDRGHDSELCVTRLAVSQSRGMHGSNSIFSLAPRPNLSLEPTSSARKFHIRRLHDILQLSIQRNDLARAKKAWAILARCDEVDWINIWETGLAVTGKATDQSFAEQSDALRMGNRERLEYLKIVMLRHKQGVSFVQNTAYIGDASPILFHRERRFSGRLFSL